MTHSPQKPALHQAWRDLCFLHWEMPVAAAQALLPEGLAADCFEGKTHIGLVPFAMRGIRPWWCPKLPHFSDFLEMNLRLYCHDRAGRAGVWFISLDCDRAAAVWGARGLWNLNYRHARMDMRSSGNRHHFTCLRRGEKEQACFAWQADAVPAPAAPGTLEHFLVERYRLFVQGRDGVLRCGEVRHAPYAVAPARLDAWSAAPFGWNGLAAPPGPPVSALASPGVAVEVFALKPVENP